MSPSRARNQSGNMLIYILGAIFLMGLLVVLVKGSMQPGTGIDAEQTSLQVNKVRTYASSLERGVIYILQNNGKSEKDIRFAHDSEPAYGTVGDVPERQMFDPAGGAVEFMDPPAGVQVAVVPWVFTGANRASEIGCTLVDAKCSDLIAILPDVTKEFCTQVNQSVGIPASSSLPKEIDFVCVNPFVGNFVASCALNTISHETNMQPEGCFEGNSGTVATGLVGHYYYYKVLLAR